MDPNTLPAGPRLDVLVATAVMGLVEGKDFGPRSSHTVESKDYDDYGEPTCSWCGLGARNIYELRNEPCVKEPPTYSGYIQHAWEVVEKIGAMRMHRDPVRDGSGRAHYGVYFLLEYNSLTDALNPNRAPHERVKFPEDPWHYTIDDAPLAICRAALAAVGAAAIKEG